jgi:hypothetical protein
MTRAADARISIVAWALAAVALNNCRSRPRPPTSMDAPRTSSTLPSTEPMIDAWTTSCSPSRSAKKAISSSGKLPKVTLSRPPMPGPTRSASSSVAFPMSAAVGITPIAEVAKISVGLACRSSSATAIGMNGTST